MKKTFKRMLSALLVAAMLVSSAPLSGFVGLELPDFGKLFDFTANAESYSGTCGDNLTWSLDTDTGVLTISGTGAMKNYSSYSSVPWYTYSSYIKTVVLPDGITSIGDWAFYYCTSLTSVTIPDSVTSIGNYAFYYCTSLTSITIPDSVTSIGSYAFCGCTSLTSITVDENNQYYSSDLYGVLFNKDKTQLIQYPAGSKITEYIIPDSVTSIGSSAFQSCTSLTSITIPDSVTDIGDWAFSDCTSLTSITIGSGVTSIGYGAFYHCTSLTSITIPDSVTSIGYSAFGECTSLTSITIGSGVTSIGNYVFSGCTSLASITVDENNQYYSSDLYGVLFNKDKTQLIQYPGGSKITEYIIPDSVTSIGNYAFYYCTSLTSITIPDSVTSIGDDAFYYCTSLTSITIPDSVTSIGYSAFRSCTSLASITIPDSITSIGGYAFSYCTSLASVTIGSGVTSIDYYAFYDCTSLASITIPDSVTSIGYSAFLGCESLTNVYYGGSEISRCDIQIESGNTPLDSATWHYNCSGHVHTEEEIRVEPTCTVDGSTHTICTDCGEIVKDVTPIPATGHSWGEWFVRKVPTCTETGVDYKTCTVCDFEETKSTDALGHDYSSEYTIDIEATCTVNGSKSRHCSRCDSKADVTAINAKGHSFGDWILRTSPTCTETGVDYRVCSDCKFEETNSTDALGHDYSVFVEYQTAHPHYAVYKCSCGAENVTSETTTVDSCETCNPHEHSYATFSHYQDEHPHYAVYKCSCGTENVTSETTTVDSCETCNPPVHTHTPKVVRIEATCTVNGMEYTICASCGEQIGAPTILPACHKWGEWYVAIAPTNEADGREERVCSACGATEEKVIPKLAETVKDDESGIELVIPNGSYDDDITLEIVEQFDGTSFQIINTSLENVSNSVVFDITTKVNGEETQPSQALTVKIPLPAGYDPNFTFVYHINSETAEVEKMESRYENGYLIFEATHFSYYSVVEIKAPTVVSLTVTAQPSVNRYKYGIENLDTSGLEIVATYSDGTTAVIDNSEVEFTGFDTSTRGVKTITATYEGCTATFDIEVYYTFWQWLLYILCFGWIWM